MSSRTNRWVEKFETVRDVALDGEAVFERRGVWRSWFADRIGDGFDGRLVFEVGCFNAEFISRIAAKHPTTAFVGLDWKYKPVYEGALRVAERGLRNVALLRGRGQDVARIFGDAEVDEVWVFHPDPCDRDVELKTRLIDERFLTDVHRVLHDERSVLSLKTDHPGYYQWVLALLSLPEPGWFAPGRARHTQGMVPERETPRVRVTDLVGPGSLPIASDAVRERFEVAWNSVDFWQDPAAIDHVARRAFAGEQTLFERRFVGKRLPIYFVELQKRASSILVE